jgi:UDP-N-acetylmuramate--alanine ligase
MSIDSPAASTIRACMSAAAPVHLLGAGGVGMAGLAALLHARGLPVSGCDLSETRFVSWLQGRGISVEQGHSPAHLNPSVSWVVRSSAVPETIDELRAARARGLPVLLRGEVLATLIDFYATSIAVSGTHGKTTTTGFIAQMLHHAGRHPAWCIGGEIPALGGIAGHGTGDCIVVEADESDGTLVHYAPSIALVTNVEFDHMEHFADVDAFEACFHTFMRQARAGVVFCADDPGASRLTARLRDTPVPPAILTYGFNSDADISATEPVDQPNGQTFDLLFHGKSCGTVLLPAPGRQHAQNALGAAAVAFLLGLSADEIRHGLHHVQLPRRRMETIAARVGITVISDYAHHPTEIAAVVRTALRLPHRRLVAVYQPHRYTRTRALAKDFPRAFAGLDDLVLTPVYAASESPLRGGSVWDLYAQFRAPLGPPPSPDGLAIPAPRVAASTAHAWHALRGELSDGDVLLVLGAGDIDALAGWASDALAEPVPAIGRATRTPLDGLTLSDASYVSYDESMAARTSLRVGGRADIWIEVADVADLQASLRWSASRGISFSLLGGGYNVLVSDLGVRGIVARLTGEIFHAIREEDGLVVVGAGVRLGDFLDWLAAHSVDGFAFLEGIPGTMGGGMQMNAGAWGGCLGDHLEWIRCLNRDGEPCIVRHSGLELGYRRCDFLRDRCLVEAAFRIRRGDASALAANRASIRERRAWMAGYRSAGSFFKNPDGDKAGRLLEAVGMHGERVGGAAIGTHHANFVIAELGTTAADVQALTERGRERVADQFGVDLEPEVKFMA